MRQGHLVPQVSDERSRFEPLTSLWTEITGDIVYHYARPDGLLGIIDSNAIWATNAWFMNDSREATYGIRAIVKFTKSLSGREGVSPKLAKLCHQSARIVSKTHRISGPYSHIACFSRHGDQLSQWRAYCRDGGFSIGLDLDGVRRAISAAGPIAPTVREVSYDPAQQQSLLDHIFQRVVAIEGRKNHESALNFVVQAVMLGPAFKHVGCSEEAEVRLHVFLGEQEMTQHVQFRIAELGVVPYLPVSLAQETGRLPLREVIVGPSPNQAESEMAVRQLLGRYGYGDEVAVRRSKLSLRV